MNANVRLKGCSSLKLRQLSRRVSQFFDAEVSSSGMKTTQYSLLSHVVRHSPVRQGQLAELLDMDASTLTRNLQPLIAQGWVRVEAGDDRRSRLVVPTPEGLAQQAHAQAAWKRAQQAFNAQMGLERVQRLHEILDECLQQFHEADEDCL